MDDREQRILHDVGARICGLLRGKIPDALEPGGYDDEVERQLAEVVNRLIESVREIHDFILPLSRGILHDSVLKRGNVLASPFKDLHARLLHLTWQAQQIANGDYSQRVDFMGDFSDAFNTMVAKLAQRQEALTQAKALLEEKVDQRTAALRAANKELAEAVAKLTTANREMEDIAYIAAHDLKTPARGIATVAQWLAEECQGRLEKRHMELLDLLMERTKRMHKLLNGVMEYCALGKKASGPEPVDLHALTTKIIGDLAAPDTVEIRIKSPLPTVICDPSCVSTILFQLIDNAVTHGDKPRGQVAIACSDEGDYWVLSVKDNGPGIESQHWERIFQMFQTLRPKDEHSHVGLGLALVKKAVELCGGRVRVKSLMGEGTTFYFTLPKTQDSPGTSPSKKPSMARID